MPAERPVNKYYPSKPGRLLPLGLRQSELEYRRRNAGTEFKQGKADVRSFPQVMKYLKRVVDDFDDRFNDYTEIFEAWHNIRVQVLDLPLGTPDFLQRSQQLTRDFDARFFTDPKNGSFLSDKYEKVKPVITEITHLVRR